MRPEPKRSPTIRMPSISGPSITSSGRVPRAPGLLGVLLDEVDDPVHERMRQPLLDRGLPPGEVALALRRLALDPLGELDQPVGRIVAAGEEHILDPLEQLGLDVLVDCELAGVDDAHVEPGADRVVQEDRVHRLAQGVVAAEREAEVGDAAARPRAGAPLLDARQCLEEGLRVLVVLLDPGRDREHVRVEDQVLRPEPDLLRQQVVGAAADPVRRSTSVAWPSSSNAITTTPAP